MLIRFATQNDEKSIFPLAKSLSQNASVEPEPFAFNLSRMISDPKSCLIVAQDGPQIAGYLYGNERSTFHANGPVAWVEELIVREGRRRKGTGSRLMHFFEEWAKRRACVYVSLATRRAGDFYGALGYESSAAYFKRELTAFG